MPNGSPPIVTIVGRKNAGKTTLVVNLCATLKQRGHRVMTIKHGSHTFNIDPATTDTYRHYHEGHADGVAMVSPDKFALVLRQSDEPTAEEVAQRYLSNADLVIGEGFRKSTMPRIEVHRAELATTPLYLADSTHQSYYRAIVTDDPQLAVRIPVIRLDHPRYLDQLADLVEREVMNR